VSGAGGTAAGGGAGGGTPTAACATAPSLMTIAGGTMCTSHFDVVPASPIAVDFWVADATTTGGGYRVMLTGLGAPISAGGHTYQFDSSDGLFGTGTFAGVSQVVDGYVDIRVDGQAAQIRFGLRGCGQQGSPPARFSAQLTRVQGTSSETVLRTYDVTMPSAASVLLTNPDLPAPCTVGVELMGIRL